MNSEGDCFNIFSGTHWLVAFYKSSKNWPDVRIYSCFSVLNYQSEKTVIFAKKKTIWYNSLSLMYWF